MDTLLQPGAPFHGAYTIVRLIGRGGIGEVYEARHDFLGRRVAIKCMRLQRSLPATMMQRMAKEAQALCTLDHPNIIRIFDAGAAADMAFMVCELLEGGTLREKLEAEGALPLIAALRYHVEWSDALVQVHAAGIIHRDLKPENVFITRAGPSKLLDFGAALDSSQRITVQGHTVGTPAYMAPEHLTGEGEIDARADVYPMGIMLFEALTGQHPFWAASEPDLPDHLEFARRHLFEPWPKVRSLNPRVPREVEAIIDRCLAKERDDRFPSMALLRDALEGALRAASASQVMPLVAPAQAAQGKTKPMPRQTAMRLNAVVGTMRMPARTAQMSVSPAPGHAVVAGVSPAEARAVRAFVPTLEDRALGAGAAPFGVAPPTGAVARTGPAPGHPPNPAARSGAILVAIAGALTLGAVALGWVLLRGPSAPAGLEAATSADSGLAVPPPPATSAPGPTPPAEPPSASSTPSPPPPAPPSAEPSADPAGPPKGPPRPKPPGPRPPKPPPAPTGPTPIFG